MALSPLSPLSSLSKMTDYFRPDKSPYLAVIATSITVLTYLCTQDNFELQFFVTAAPVVIVLVCFTKFSLVSIEIEGSGRGLEAEKQRKIDQQLKLSRSVGIMCGVLCLAIGGTNTVYEIFLVGKFSLDVDLGAFAIILVFSTVHILIFVLFSAIHVIKREPTPSSAFVHMALITSAFLVGATICMYSADELKFIMEYEVKELISDNNGIRTVNTNEVAMNKFLLTSIVLYLHWIWCQVHWVKQLCGIVQVSIVEDPK